MEESTSLLSKTSSQLDLALVTTPADLLAISQHTPITSQLTVTNQSTPSRHHTPTLDQPTLQEAA